MSELGNGYSPTMRGGAEGASPEPPAVPFLPPPPGPAAGPPGMLSASIPVAPGTMPPTGRFAQAPTDPHPAPSVPTETAMPTAESAPAPPESPAGQDTEIDGQIRVEAEVIEKIAALAAMEVKGIAGLSGESARAGSAGQRTSAGRSRGDQGVQAKVHDGEVSLEVAVVVEYGVVVMEVAKAVKSKVAQVTGRMLGMRVTSVGITVDDVRLPGEHLPGQAGPAGRAGIDQRGRQREQGNGVRPGPRTPRDSD